MIKSNT
jgi:hypothetical protein